MKTTPAFLTLALSLAAPAAAVAQQCSIEYQRADNSFAAPGRPDGKLGKETLTLGAGETKVFITDWKYEKQRNDGHNYYGSHLRIIRNSGQQPVKVVLRGGIGSRIPVGGVVTQVIGDRGHGELKPGQSDNNLRADLMEVTCEAKEARGGGQTPGGTANAAPHINPPGGLVARLVSPEQIRLEWQPVPNAREYRVYVSPPPQPHMAGKPGIVGGNGGSFVIPIPRNVAPTTVYQASIEAVGKDGSVSPRVAFNSVPVQLAGPGGGPSTGGGPSSGGPTNPPTGPATPGLAGQQCPPGQFVTGFGATGTILCAAPPR